MTIIDRKILLHVDDGRIQMQLAKEIMDHNLEGIVERRLKISSVDKKRHTYYELLVCGKSETAASLFFHLVGLFPGAKVEMDVATSTEVSIYRGYGTNPLSSKNLFPAFYSPNLWFC